MRAFLQSALAAPFPTGMMYHFWPPCSFAGCQDADAQEPTENAGLAIKKLGGLLKQTLEELFGPTLLLSSSSMELMFPASFGRLSTTFYRSKVTSWMAAQEEDYRFASCSSG